MQKIPFKEAFLFWLKLGFISFGGPAGQIAIMHEYLVDKRKWISESKFLHALNYCMLLPGPEAQQLATYTGWLMNGIAGGLTAGILFILPSVFIMLALSSMYVVYGKSAIVYSLFAGVKPAVIAIILLALWKISERALLRGIDYIVTGATLVALLLFNVPYPLVIIAAIALGFIYSIFFREKEEQGNETTPGDKDENDFIINGNAGVPHTKVSVPQFLQRGFIFLIFWIAPFVLLYFFTSDFVFWKQLNLYFTSAAIFTFGGAYSALFYVAQTAVQKLHWLTQTQMIDGLAMGETTPGPLMMVLTFVGFIGSWQHFGGSVAAGCLGLILTTWYTFFPSFVFVLLGAPVIEKTHQNKLVKMAFTFVTAAVTGVIINLAVYMAKGVLFPYTASLKQIDVFAAIWVIASLFGLKQLKINTVFWIVFSAAIGLARHYLMHH